MMKILKTKSFLNNLGKWICMYVGTLLLFATIVTYSKYISKFDGSSDNNKTARFELTLSDNQNENNSNGKTYNISENPVLTYSFKVDASKMDVKSKLKLWLFVDNSFEVTSDAYTKCTQTDDSKCPSKNGKTMYTLGTIDLPTTNELIYEIQVKYIGDPNNLPTDEVSAEEINVVDVGYAVEQVSVN